jgi:hypothetical protein
MFHNQTIIDYNQTIIHEEERKRGMRVREIGKTEENKLKNWDIFYFFLNKKKTGRFSKTGTGSPVLSVRTGSGRFFRFEVRFP